MSVVPDAIRDRRLICVDLGRSRCKFWLGAGAAASGDVQAISSAEQQFLADLADPNLGGYHRFLDFLAATASDRGVQGVALSVPFAVDPASGLLATGGEAGWPTNTEIVSADCKQDLGVGQVAVVNDAVAFAAGFLPRHPKSVSCVTLGTNYGCAVRGGDPFAIQPVEVNGFLGTAQWPSAQTGGPSHLLRKLPFQFVDAHLWSQGQRRQYSTLSGWVVGEIQRRTKAALVVLGGGRCNIVDRDALEDGIRQTGASLPNLVLDGGDHVAINGAGEIWRRVFLNGEDLGTFIKPPYFRAVTME